MIGVNKIVKQIASEKPQYRYLDWIDFHGEKPDNRTRGQLVATIKSLTENNPAVKNFTNSLLSMDTKYLGLAADTLELAQRKMFNIGPSVDMNKPGKDGKSLVQTLLGLYPKAAKENPNAMELAKEVLNNTSSTTSKYFLANFVKELGNPAFSENYKAVKPLVKDIADSTVKVPVKENLETFMEFFNMFFNKNADVEKIKIIPQLAKIADEIPGENPLYIDAFVQSKTPIEQVSANLKTLKEVGNLANSQGKSFDMVDFVNNNVNLD